MTTDLEGAMHNMSRQDLESVVAKTMSIQDMAKTLGLSVDDMMTAVKAEQAAEVTKAKEARDKLQKEIGELQTKRDALAITIKGDVSKLGLDSQIKELKGIGFQYTIDRVEKVEGQPDLKITGGTVILTQGYKQSRTTTPGLSNGNRGGKLKDLFESSATPAEKSALEAATTKARIANPTARIDAIEYQHRKAVATRLGQ